MAIIKFDKSGDFANRFRLHPSRSYTSSSLGATGSLRLTTVKPGLRKSLRADDDAPAFDSGLASDKYLRGFENKAKLSPSGSNPDPADFFDAVSDMFEKVQDVATFGPDTKVFEVDRFTPYLETVTIGGTTLSVSSTGSFRKNTIRQLLYPRYRGQYRKCDWSYSNAHTINFFTASTVESSCAVIYPDPTGSDASSTAFYRPDRGFTFEFFLNPRYTTDGPSDAFNAGTILHYSSAYAVSLVTGSSRGADGRPDGFRLLLQLSSSAEVPPSSIAFDEAPSAGREMIYSSSDNSLSLGNWHHVAIRWGGSDAQNYTGSFVIDGTEDTTFVIPSASITAPPGQASYAGWGDREDSNALFVGNFFEGTNAGVSAVSKFFNSSAATREGVAAIPDAGSADPTGFSLNHKLNAELHELRVFKEFRDSKQIDEYRVRGFNKSEFETETSGSLAFYVPPFFVVESPDQRRFERPFNLATTQTTQTTPFNVTMSFNNEGFILNQANFFRDFANSSYPRFFNLTGSTALTVDSRPANEQLLLDPQMMARNFLILPNDNGSFTPGYGLLLTGTFERSPTTESLLRRFVNDSSVTDFSVVSLNRMLDGKEPIAYNNTPQGSLFEPTYPAVRPEGPGTRYGRAFYPDIVLSGDSDDVESKLSNAYEIGEFFDYGIIERGFNAPYDPSFRISSEGDDQVFYVFEATGDESSNQAVFFNIPNVFYGQRIKPGTFTLTDSSVTGSSGKMSITLRDDGFGNLYRADSPVPNTLHSVGNVFYEEGIVSIKSPHLYLFGSGSYSIGFKGTQDVVNRELLVEAPKNTLNASSNPTFLELAPTDEANETADSFVYLTTVLLHDEDLNVIGRATVSQPVPKRKTDAITFRLKKDF